MLDWVTGDPNAKCRRSNGRRFLPLVFFPPSLIGRRLLADFVTQLLASTIGAAAEKALFPYTAAAAGGGNASAALYALPFRFTSGSSKGVLLINKKADPLTVTVGGMGGASARVVEVAPGFAGGPGFQPTQDRRLSAAGAIQLGPFAVAVVGG